MNEKPDWLPELVLFKDSRGQWEQYVELLYDIFKKDFIISQPKHVGRKVFVRLNPIEKGKAATFWHVISEGAVEAERIPDLRRCERIKWPRAIIESNDRQEVRVWESKKKGGRLYLFMQFNDENYFVVLRRGRNFLLLLTAFIVDRAHQVNKLLKEYTLYKKLGSPI